MSVYYTALQKNSMKRVSARLLTYNTTIIEVVSFLYDTKLYTSNITTTSTTITKFSFHPVYLLTYKVFLF